jgi:hypothetical protein
MGIFFGQTKELKMERMADIRDQLYNTASNAAYWGTCVTFIF